MSIVFFGTPEFAVPSLRALIRSGEDIRMVVTQTDKVQGRGHRLSPPPVKTCALEAGVRVLQPRLLNDETFLSELRAVKPELIVVVAYGKLLPAAILSLPPAGCINVHASLLPKYRGAAPIAWAIIHGEEKTGVTTMRMNEGLDTGDILLQREIAIGKDDTAAMLSAKLSEFGASLLIETIRGLRAGSVKPSPQTGETNYAPPLTKEDGRIDWSHSAREISDFVRGMQPWPGAFCEIGGERVMLLRVAPAEGSAKPGAIAGVTKHSFSIGTGRGLLSVGELQPAGKKPMSAAAFIHGRSLQEGTPIG